MATSLSSNRVKNAAALIDSSLFTQLDQVRLDLNLGRAIQPLVEVRIDDGPYRRNRIPSGPQRVEHLLFPLQAVGDVLVDQSDGVVARWTVRGMDALRLA